VRDYFALAFDLVAFLAGFAFAVDADLRMAATM
jgi:hypothetical protein